MVDFCIFLLQTEEVSGGGEGGAESLTGSENAPFPPLGFTTDSQKLLYRPNGNTVVCINLVAQTNVT